MPRSPATSSRSTHSPAEPRLQREISAPPRRHLSVKEFSAICGLSPATIRRLIKAGKIPSVQPGGPGTRILIPENSLDLLFPTHAETSGQAGEDSVANPVADPVDASSSASSPASSLSSAHRRGPMPRWLSTSAR